MRKRIFKITLILSMLLLCTGCARTEQTEENVQFYKVGIDGDKIAYSSDDKDVIEIKEAALGYTEATVSANYNNPSLEKENTYYSKDTLEKYIDLGRDEVIINRIVGAELKQKLDSAELSEIIFKKIQRQQCAEVYVDSIVVVEHAIDDWLSAMGDMKLNTKYKRTYILSFVLDDDNTWKISNYDYTDFEEVK